MNDFVDQFGRTIHQVQVTDDAGAVSVVATASDGSLEARFPLASYSQAFALSTFNAMGPQVTSLQIERSTPVPVLFVKGDGTPAPSAPDGRPDVRITTAKRTTNFSLRIFSFYTAKLGSIHNVNPVTNADFGDATLRLYDSGGAEITDESLQANAVKTVIDWEPAYNYEIIGGYLDIPTALKDGTTDAWFMSVIGVPDYPAPNGQIPYISEVNLEAVTTQKVVSDGRAISYLPYQYGGAPGTNKLRFTFKHAAGTQQRFQLYVEHFR